VLFDRYAYSGSVIFGHAKDGNLHFMVVERFSSDAAPGRYAGFTEEMVDLILGYGGTLKAEHGTGRIMAPFVRRQFGDELHAVMREIKLLCDPRGILNPDVVLTEDPQLHLRDLKVVPTIEPEVDRCVECGYCEAVCPSADLTTTPRQRIVLRRELAAAHAAGDFQLVRELQNDYRYDAVETCAVDGMCAIACPVQINTGDLTRRLRTQANGAAVDAVWGMLASNWNTATRAIGFGLSVAAALPAVLPAAASRAARLALGADRMPAWQPDLPRGGVPRHPRLVDEADAVYVPSCLNTLFAPAEAGPGVMAAVLALAERAGVRLLIPRGIAGLCCGTPWSSKGLRAGHQRMRRKVQRVVQHASRGGALPVITDAASCAEGFQKELGTITVIDAVVYSANILLPRLRVRRRLESLVVHPTCSSTHIGSNEALMVLANAIADEVLLPENWRCCGFAGDRGMLHPELTASATSTEAAEVRARRFRAYASVNRPCEIGMTRATGETYHHLLELVEQCTR
jgi:D-lactate dehydrogenase